MSRERSRFLVALSLLLAFALPLPIRIPTSALCQTLNAVALNPAETISAASATNEYTEARRTAVRALLKMEEGGAQWPCECTGGSTYGLRAGARLGSTALVVQSLLFGAPDKKDAQAAVQRGLASVLKLVEHPRMGPESAGGNYDDYRVWGQIFALECLCHVRDCRIAGDSQGRVDAAIARLVQGLIAEEKPAGGWHYAGGRQAALHVTAPAAQALLLARSQGERVSDDLLTRARRVLEQARYANGAFAYHGSARESGPGSDGSDSVGRSIVCETTLVLLGGGSTQAVQAALHNLFKNWQMLEQCRKKSGTHLPPYGIAPYYFYYSCRYAAQAIQMLPKEKRPQERQQLLKRILTLQDEDGTWNDRDFSRGRNYGTAMMLLILLGDEVPLPPKWTKPQ